MAGLFVETEGFGEPIHLAIDHLVTAVRGAASAAILREAHYELAVSQLEVPVDTGNLRDSGRVEADFEEGEAEGTEDLIEISIAYGGPSGAGKNLQDVDYAIVVHEDLEASHPRGGKAKFLEDPVRDEWASGRAQARIAADMRTLMQSTLVAFASKAGHAVRGAKGRFMGSTKS